MSIVVVGSVAYDTVETDHGGRGGWNSAAQRLISLWRRGFLPPVSMVAVVGEDFKPEHERMLTERGYRYPRAGASRRQNLPMARPLP